MKIGLIGLPSSGKTTFFSLLSNKGSSLISNTKGKTEANFATVRVPDRRVDFLGKIYKPRKITYASIDIVDIRGIIPGSGDNNASSYHFFDEVRKADVLVHIVRAFEDDSLAHLNGSIDPFRDIKTLDVELIFADLALIDKRISSITNGKKVTSRHLEELEVLHKCQKCLEEEKPLAGVDLDEHEKDVIKSYDFLTLRPVIYLINTDEPQYRSGIYPNCRKVRDHTSENGMPLIEVCAKTELEIMELEEEDRDVFLQDLGVGESGIDKLAGAMYRELGLISFLTVGEDEVRAWPVRKGSSAQQAGGRIHSDISRGFIRAEVAGYADFEKLGSMQKLRENGLVRLEGRDYIIEDGDVVNFRFNV